jgi:hypothetical protein
MDSSLRFERQFIDSRIFQVREFFCGHFSYGPGSDRAGYANVALKGHFAGRDRWGQTQFPTNAFFDTCYHLVEEAAKERTKRLIEEFRPLCGQR